MAVPLWPGPALAETPKLDGTRPLDDPLVCLARAIYFEARGQSETEMAAVGYVVVNRVLETRYPDDICAVVRDGGQQGPCQFSWWCDGRSDIARDRREYNRAIRVARGIMAAQIADPTGGANMFHNGTVKPRWARKARLKRKIGAQFFYYLAGR